MAHCYDNARTVLATIIVAIILLVIIFTLDARGQVYCPPGGT